jgi:RNA recognition motif-containing protein
MNICVRNLPPETSLSELLRCFEIFGKVTEVSINTYKVDGTSRGLGFIEMPSNDHGHAAIAGLQDKELSGKLLKVREE